MNQKELEKLKWKVNFLTGIIYGFSLVTVVNLIYILFKTFNILW